MKLIIYTVITGGYDTIRQPAVIDDRFRYFCFSNDFSEEKIGVWEIRKIPPVLKDNQRLLAKGRALYEEKTGIKVFPLLIQDKRFPWLQATIDGFSEDFTKLLMVGFGEESIKNAQKMKKQSNQSMSLSQVARAQHLLMITGLEEVDYWCYDISGDKTPVLLTIKRDQKKIKQLYELEKKIVEQLNEDEVDNLSNQFTDILKGAGMKF